MLAVSGSQVAPPVWQDHVSGGNTCDKEGSYTAFRGTFRLSPQLMSMNHFSARLTITSVLLCNHTVSLGQSALANALTDFSNGSTLTYSSKIEPKAEGLEFSLRYPKSWSTKPSNRPNILVKLIAPEHEAMALVQSRKLSAPVSTQEKKEFFTTATLKEMIPEGSVFLTCRPDLTIEGLPAASVEYTSIEKRMDQSFYTHNMMYLTLYKQYLVSVIFTCGGLESESRSAHDTRFKEYKPLFYSMFNSLVIAPLYK